MEGLKIYSQSEVTALTSVREGETKLGQKMQVHILKSSNSSY